MKITLTGSLGNISKPLAEILIKNGHKVTIISNESKKVSEIEALGTRAAIGSVSDVTFLTNAFKGANAIYTMVPPNWGVVEMGNAIDSGILFEDFNQNKPDDWGTTKLVDFAKEFAAVYKS